MIFAQLILTENLNQIFSNIFFYLFITALIIIVIILSRVANKTKKRNDENRLSQQQHTAKIDMLRKEYSDMLEKVRVEMLKREDERRKQWIESEKETLHVLNGVAMLIDMNIKLGRNEVEKLLKKLDEIREKLERITPQ